MALNLDELLKRLLSDLAVAGTEGVDHTKLRQLICDFSKSQTAHKQASPPADELDSLFSTALPSGTPNIDDKYVAKVWGWLAADSRTIVFTHPPTEEAASTQPGDQVPLPSPPSQHMRLSDESVWQAITGHGVDNRLIPNLEFKLLEIIARHGRNGLLQPDLLAASGQDKRSLPRRTDHLAEKGYITKVPALGGGQKTSFLRLARFADEAPAPTSDRMQSVGESAGSGNTIFYDVWFKETIRLLKANEGIIAFDDIRRGLGIQGKRWETRAYVRCIRRLCKSGCVRRLKAKAVYEESDLPKGAKPGLSRCLQLVREPTPLDEVAFAKMQTSTQTKTGNALVKGVRDEQGHDADATLDPEGDDPWDDAGSVDDAEELDLDALDGRVHPQWTPDLPYPNLMYNLIDSAGPKGMTSMELQKQSFGSFFRRPLDELMVRLTEVGETSQPVHLRHLGIIRDTSMTGKTSHYVYRTRHNFDKAVEAGDAMWSAVQELARSGPKTKEKTEEQEQKKAAAAQPEAELDDYGFVLPPAWLFADTEGRADLVSLSAPYSDALRKDAKSHMARTMGGKPSVLNNTHFPASGRPSSARVIPEPTRPSTPGTFTPINAHQKKQRQKPGAKLGGLKKQKPEGGRTGTIVSVTPNVQGMAETDFAKNARKIAERIAAAEEVKKKRTFEDASFTDDEGANKAARMEGDEDHSHEENGEDQAQTPGQKAVQTTEPDSNDLVGLFSSTHSFLGGTRSATSSPAPSGISTPMGPPPVPRRRGRPRKNPLPSTSMAPPPLPKKRGRPSKKDLAERKQREEEASQQTEVDTEHETETSAMDTTTAVAEQHASSASGAIDTSTADVPMSDQSPRPQVFGKSSLSQEVVIDSGEKGPASEISITPAAPTVQKRGRPTKAMVEERKRQEEAEAYYAENTPAESDADDALPTSLSAGASLIPKKRGRPTKAEAAERKRRKDAEAAQDEGTPPGSEADTSLFMTTPTVLPPLPKSRGRGRPTKAEAEAKKRHAEAVAAALPSVRDPSPTSTLMAAFDGDSPAVTPVHALHQGSTRPRADTNKANTETEPEPPTTGEPSNSIESRVAQIEAELLARSRPGIYINPPGAAATKNEFHFHRGRPRRALIAVVKTEKLRQLPWFQAQEPVKRTPSVPAPAARPLVHGKDYSVGAKATKIRRSRISTGLRAGRGEERSSVLVGDSDEEEVEEEEEEEGEEGEEEEEGGGKGKISVEERSADSPYVWVPADEATQDKTRQSAAVGEVSTPRDKTPLVNGDAPNEAPTTTEATDASTVEPHESEQPQVEQTLVQTTNAVESAQEPLRYQNTTAVTAPEIQEMDPKDAQASIAGHKRGLIGHRRVKIILDTLAKTNGVFPGRNEMWFPFVRAWQQYGPGEIPDRATVFKSVKYLISSGNIKRMVFRFNTRSTGKVQEHSILALPDIDANDPKVLALQGKMMDSYPSLYLPPEAGVPPEMLHRDVYANPKDLAASVQMVDKSNQPNGSEAEHMSTHGRWKDEYPEEEGVVVKRTAGAPLPAGRKKQIPKPKVVFEDSDDEIEEEDVPSELANFRMQFQLGNYEHDTPENISWRRAYNSHGRLPGNPRKRGKKGKKAAGRAARNGWETEDPDSAVDASFSNNSLGEMPNILANTNMAQQLSSKHREFGQLEQASKRKLGKAGGKSTKRRSKRDAATVPGEMPAWQSGPDKGKKRFEVFHPLAPVKVTAVIKPNSNELPSLLNRNRRYRKNGVLTMRAREEMQRAIKDEWFRLQQQELEEVEIDWFEPKEYCVHDNDVMAHMSSGTFGTVGVSITTRAEAYAAKAEMHMREFNTEKLPLSHYKSLVQRPIEGIEDILKRATRLHHVAAHPDENRQYKFDRDVDRVATWERNLFQGGCLLHTGDSTPFVNHVLTGKHERELADLEGRVIDLDTPENEVYTETGESKPLWEIHTETPQDFGQLRSMPIGQHDEDFAYTSIMDPDDNSERALDEDPDAFVPLRPAAKPRKNKASFKAAPHPRVARPKAAPKKPSIYKSKTPKQKPSRRVAATKPFIHNLADLYAERDRPSKFKRSDRHAAKDFIEQDRLMICMTISRALFGGVTMNHNWRLVAIAMRSRYDPNFLRRRWDNIKQVYETRFYKMHDEFQKVFLEAYEKDETPLVDFVNVENSDWKGLVEWFEKNVKVEVTHEEAPVKTSEEAVDLPAFRADLERGFEVTERAETWEVSREVQFNVHTMKTRREALGHYVYGTKLAPEKGDSLILAKTWFRASVLCTDEVWAKHSPQEVAAKMSLFGNATIDRVTTELGDSGGRMIKHGKKGRKVPGRNFVFTEYANSLFKRWPHGVRNVPETEYLPTVANDRSKILEQFEKEDYLSLKTTVSDTEMLVLTNMVAQGHIKPVPQLPARNDDFYAPYPKLTQWPYTDENYSTRGVDKSRFNQPVHYVKTDAFTTEHPLVSNVPIPTKPHPHLNEPGSRIPMWMDIFGNFLPERWEQCLRSFLHLLVYRPGISAKEIEKSHKEKAWVFEIEMVLGWLEQTGLAERWGEGSVDEWGVWLGGWRASEWWYLCMVPEVRTWLPKGEVMEGEVVGELLEGGGEEG